MSEIDKEIKSLSDILDDKNEDISKNEESAD